MNSQFHGGVPRHLEWNEIRLGVATGEQSCRISFKLVQLHAAGKGTCTARHLLVSTLVKASLEAAVLLADK